MFTGHIFATSPRTVRGKPTPLKGDPTGKNFLYTNGNSVIIRDIEVSFKISANHYDNCLSHRNYMHAARYQLVYIYVHLCWSIANHKEETKIYENILK